MRNKLKSLSHSTTSTRSVIAWGLYDWANSAFPTVIITFIFAAYFTQSVAKDPISGTHQWGNATALAGFIIALFSPILGAAADYLGRCKPWVAFFTFITILSSALLWFTKPSPDYINWALCWVVMGTVGFELSTVFYNAMMQDIVPKSYLGRLSGWAWGIGYLGGLGCLSVALVLIYFPLPWLTTATSAHVRIAGPLTAIWFGLFSLPFFIFTVDRQETGVSFWNAMKKGRKALVKTFQQKGANRQILLYLIAHMIYMDGLNTLFAFGGIYAAGVFGLSPVEIIILGISMNAMAGIGAIGFGWVDDYLGSKNTILLSLGGLILLASSVLIIHSVVIFWVLALLLSLFVGPIQSASRSLMAHIAPPEQLMKSFGLYAFSGKVTAFMGPWILGMMTISFGSQRIGMSTVIVFLILGGIILLGVKNDQK